MPRLVRVLRVATAISLAATIVVGCREAPAATPAPVRPPNVVVIVMDTTRADRCSFLGYERPTTPALEALADEGVRFTQALAPAPWTAPSHASLFTGQLPARHGLTGDGLVYLADGARTLAERLRDAGYVTAAYSTNPVVQPGFGLAQGFDTFDEAYTDLPPYPYARSTHMRGLDVAREAAAEERPFFLFFNHAEPHLPYTPTTAHQRRFLRRDVSPGDLAAARAFSFPAPVLHNLGLRTVSGETIATLSDLYDAGLASLDEEIGRFADQLRADGLLDRTVFIVTSDHGENLGERGLVDHMFSIRRTLLHVPLLARFPDAFDGGRVVDAPVGLEDIAPTVLELCGLDAATDMDGISLTDPSPDRVMIGRFGDPRLLLEKINQLAPTCDTTRFRGTSWSVHHGRHHLIRNPDDSFELYDFVADPLEQHDLAAKRPETVARLRGLLPHAAR